MKMTPEEALKIAERSLEAFEFVPEAYNYSYTKLCAAALEKQIPKKPKRDFDNVCPERQTPRSGTVVFSWQKYCPKCGQRLDWTEEKENNK